MTRRAPPFATAVALALLAGAAARAQTAAPGLADLLSRPIPDEALPDLVPAAADGVLIAGRAAIPDPVTTAAPEPAPPTPRTLLAAVPAAPPLARVPPSAALEPVPPVAPLAPVAPPRLDARIPDPADSDDLALLGEILGTPLPEGFAPPAPDPLPDPVPAPAPAPEPAPAPTDPPDTGPEPEVLTGKALDLALQQELQRMNCYSGSLDGDFGRGSTGALDLFFKESGLTPATPERSQAVLDQLRTAAAQVCDEPFRRAAPQPAPAATGNGGTATAKPAPSTPKAPDPAPPKPAEPARPKPAAPAGDITIGL